MPLSANSVTKTPPPAAAKAAPYELGAGSITLQPAFELTRWEQSVELTTVEDCSGDTCLQPGSVCNVIWLFSSMFQCSNVSISPPVGQFGACDQNAGHTEH